MRTQVAIVGAGPAGLLLAHLLDLQGVDSVVLETRSRAHVESRIRAGILEQGAVGLLADAGVGGRVVTDGEEHRGIYLNRPGERHYLDFARLCGRTVWAYGQTQLQRDLGAARDAAGQVIHYEVRDVELDDLATEHPTVRFVDAAGVAHVLSADAVAGCDGSHGVSAAGIPHLARRTWERMYPYAWLTVLADVAPSTDHLIYAWHPEGFALHSFRSPTLSRLYLQVSADDSLQAWPDDRVWDQLATRLSADGWSLTPGPVLEKSITPMRSRVCSPMSHGRLFLAGDAAHIVPPTGAKGLNLAIADVSLLSQALVALVVDGRPEPAAAYSATALRRVWRCTHFSWWMTSMLHRVGDDFDAQLQLAQLAYVCSSEAASTSLAENYTGMPYGW